MYVDVHNHLLPDPYVSRLLEWNSPVGLERTDEGLFMVHQRSGTASVKAGDQIPLNPGFTDIDARLQWMDDNDVDRTLVSVSTPNPLAEAFDTRESTELVRSINDGYADIQSRYPDHVAGLGMLPLREPTAAVREVDRIASDLGLAGVAVPTSINGTKLSRDELAPVFEAVDERDLTVFVHPHGNALSDTLTARESFLNPLVVFPTETTLQIARLLYDGFFDAHDFDVVLSHMGGAVLHLAGRINRGRDESADPDAPPARPVLEYLQEFYYDVVSFHPPALRAAIETVGVEQFVFGTDYPFDEEDTETIVADLNSAVPAKEDQQRIASETAQELFDL